ncbi:heavy-metal resistance protein CzcE [Collimonas sp. PA-H2]|uniref:CzcE family metal-binding protein n=1 Tax=Collimonas sp. PA-H2 TaxID=1881062 RepID=UPI000BF31DA8|nr:CzcE family metal-binding protein [Collimonas sp. PA-H2]PFH10452.1 heavy-metal resistance protein CzcE [Collimonas sp. PA-H2]
MNPKLLIPAIAAATLCAACSLPPRIDLLGDPAVVTAATRTIVITPDTSYVNVTGGEIIRFVVGDKSFAWNFDGADYLEKFDLNQTAPPGMLDHKVIAYVAANPLYSGGGDGHHHGDGHGGGHGGDHGGDFTSGGGHGGGHK